MPALLLLRGKSPFPYIAVLDVTLHARSALECSFVTHFAVNIGDFEGEFHLVALHGPRDGSLAEHSSVGAGQLFAVLLEFERRAAAALGCFDGKFPGARNIGGEGGARECGCDQSGINGATYHVQPPLFLAAKISVVPAN